RSFRLVDVLAARVKRDAARQRRYKYRKRSEGLIENKAVPLGVVVTKVYKQNLDFRQRKQDHCAPSNLAGTALDANDERHGSVDRPQDREDKLFCVLDLGQAPAQSRGGVGERAVEMACYFRAKRNHRKCIRDHSERGRYESSFASIDAFILPVEPCAGAEGEDHQRK